jgi:hypothetical protein
MRLTLRSIASHCFAAGLLAFTAVAGDDPKPKPENTISIHLAEAVPPQKFLPAPKFWIVEVVDRAGNPQPMMLMKPRGGIFLDRLPTAIVREALEDSLKSANLMATDANSADLALRVYLFHFGLAEGSAMDYFGKVEFTAIVKNAKTGESQEVKANGTSIAKTAARKQNLQKNVQEDVQEALKDAIRNFVRGQQLKQAVAALWKGTDVPGTEAVKP